MGTTDTVIPLIPDFHCLACGSDEGTVRIDEVEFEYGRGDRTTTLVAHTPVHICDVCQAEIIDKQGERAKHTAICRYLGILTPTEIHELRNGLGMSREELAELTGLGTASLARWETGSHPQNAAYDRLLRLLRVPGVVDALQSMADADEIYAPKLPQLRSLEVNPSLIEKSRHFELA
ncbi:MAG: helix-turn-helix domain-containing protein [Parvibaculaceae bacterium]